MARVLVNTVSLSSGALTRERNLLRAIGELDDSHRYEVLCTPDTRQSLDALPERFALHEVTAPGGTPRRIAWENTGLLRQVRRLNPDLLYFPLHITNLFDTVPKVSAVRNAAPFYPEAHEGAPVSERLRLRGLRAATRRTVRQSERVVFMSETTRDRVAERIPEAAEKGVVVPHGIPDGFEPGVPTASVRDRYGLPDRFLLSVSNLVRYKNLVELVDGYAFARESADEGDLPPLCLAGKTNDSDYERAVRKRIAAHGLEERFRLLGYVDHGDLPALHAACEAFVFPSACENAPVTLIEALACGDAIACSHAASMPEICGDAARYFDPYDPQSIGAALADLGTDPGERERLSRAALERAEAFDWTESAARTSELFTGIASEGQP